MSQLSGFFTKDCVPRFECSCNIFSRRRANTCAAVDCPIQIQHFKNIRTKVAAELAKLLEAHLVKPSILLQGVRDKFADNLMTLPEWNVVQDEVIGEVGCQQPRITSSIAHSPRVDFRCCHHSRINLKRQLDLIN